MIYFAQNVNGGPIKIGTTYDLDQRIKGLVKVLGGKVRVLGVMKGSFKTEHKLHVRFSHVRHSAGREFFDDSDDLILFIYRNSKAWTPKPNKPRGRKPKPKEPAWRTPSDRYVMTMMSPKMRGMVRELGEIFFGHFTHEQIIRWCITYTYSNRIPNKKVFFDPRM